MSDQTVTGTQTESNLPGLLGVVDTAIARIEAVMLAAGVLLMAANTVANVIGRFVLQSSIYFSEELNSILIVLITFAGISYAARHGRHIRMSAIFDTLPAPVPRGHAERHRSQAPNRRSLDSPRCMHISSKAATVVPGAGETISWMKYSVCCLRRRAHPSAGGWTTSILGLSAPT